MSEVQKAFNIQKEDSFIVTVKNPHKKQTQGVGLPSKDKVEYPEEIQEIFDDHAWIPVEPELLEFEGTEMIWIPSGHDIEHGLGKAGKKLEQIVDTKNAKDVMAEAHLDPDEHPTQALKDGKWPSPSKE
ncbi:unnamed protein product [Didymodactylos carnosus]|uniref:Uncharacterized protein n=1 Tax=Didymodactylos carnosus TaxID=1234261 RepID=A0A8S2CY12_9BILA|nr:unnamed protein product [Didymodactylos carnosus]CAF3573404.1 unnamed protein product [Didymodactylos carnosus]